MFRSAASTLILVCALVAPAGASVVLIDGDMGNSTEGLCDFTGSVEYNYLGGNAGEVVITLKNTTNPDIGGFLTGFVFNVGDASVSLDLDAATHPFDELTNESAPPFGTFVSGAALGGEWTGGGTPQDGIAVGDTGVFEFSLSSADAANILAGDFLTGANDFNFVARFRGLADGGSDKVPGGEVIPAPGAAALLGLAGLTAARRRRA